MNKLDFEKILVEEPEIDFELFYNTYFIEINEQNNIIKGWSSAFAPATKNSIIINEQGSYQFRLFPNGEENPNLFTIDNIPLYKWENQKVIQRTEAEINEERKSLQPIQIPKSKIEVLEENLLQQDLTITELYENQLTQDQAICELYELMEAK